MRDFVTSAKFAVFVAFVVATIHPLPTRADSPGMWQALACNGQMSPLSSDPASVCQFYAQSCTKILVAVDEVTDPQYPCVKFAKCRVKINPTSTNIQTFGISDTACPAGLLGPDKICGQRRCMTNAERAARAPYNCFKCDRDTCQGNPTVVQTGEKVETAYDYMSSGPIPLSVTRYYFSRLSSGANSSVSGNNGIGSNWRLSFDHGIGGPVGTAMYVTLATGQIYDMRPVSTGSVDYIPFESESDVRLKKFTTPVAAYEFTDEEDNVIRFELVGTIYLVKSIKQRSGYTQTFTYTSGRVSAMADSLGHKLIN